MLDVYQLQVAVARLSVAVEAVPAVRQVGIVVQAAQVHRALQAIVARQVDTVALRVVVIAVVVQVAAVVAVSVAAARADDVEMLMTD